MSNAIFGANGYIGSHLAGYLFSHGEEVCLFDRQEKPSSPGLEYHSCDISSLEFWQNFPVDEFSAIYFMAGLSGVEDSFKNCHDFIGVNVNGLLNLLQRLEPLGTKAPKIIFPSSRLVYRGGGEVTEESPLEARSVYAASKISCECLLQAFHHRYGIPYAVLRIGVPYGEFVNRDYSSGTLFFFKRRVFAGKPIIVYGDGQCSKTYTYIKDLCCLFRIAALSSNVEGVYNVGGHNYTLREVAETVASAYNGVVQFAPWPQSASSVEMGNIVLNSTKLSSTIGYYEYERMENLPRLGVCL